MLMPAKFVLPFLFRTFDVRSLDENLAMIWFNPIRPLESSTSKKTKSRFETIYQNLSDLKIWFWNKNYTRTRSSPSNGLYYLICSWFSTSKNISTNNFSLLLHPFPFIHEWVCFDVGKRSHVRYINPFAGTTQKKWIHRKSVYSVQRSRMPIHTDTHSQSHTYHFYTPFGSLSMTETLRFIHNLLIAYAWTRDVCERADKKSMCSRTIRRGEKKRILSASRFP